MKFILSAAILMSITAYNLIGQTSNNFEFEQNMPVIVDTFNSSNIWEIGTPSKTIFNSALSVPNSITTDSINPYPINNISSFTIKINTSDLWAGFPYFVIMWNQKMDCEIGKDGGIIEVSYDSASTWMNIFQDTLHNPLSVTNYEIDTLFTGEFGYSKIDTTWKNIGFCWSSSGFSNVEEVFLRFIFKSDSIETNQEGWLIDNFVAYETIIDAVDETSSNSRLATNVILYPNPVESKINIEFVSPLNSMITYEIISINGKLELKGNSLVNNTLSINTNSLNSGFYIIYLRDNEKNLIYKAKIVKTTTNIKG